MNKLFKLLVDNKQAQARRPVQAETSGNEATVYLYDMIVDSKDDADWYGGIYPEQFVKELAGIEADIIHLRINSPGGSVFAARTMETAIRQHGAKVVAHVDGYAASAASLLAVACDETEISQGAFFMIHKAWSMTWGNADDMLAAAELLEKIDDALVDTYAAKTGKDRETLAEMMRAETWLSAEESVALGFADRLAEAKTSAKASWNLAAYAHAPAVPDAPADQDTAQSTAQAVPEATAASAPAASQGPQDQKDNGNPARQAAHEAAVRRLGLYGK